MNDLDYSKIQIDPVKQPRIYTADLGQLDFAKLRAISKLINKSGASIAQTALYTYLARNWPEHYNRLLIEAKQHNLSPEEYFEKLVNEPK